MDASALSVHPQAAEPIYRQIVGQLRRMIVSGQLSAGESLPSVRDVAGFHAINPMTVSRAYSMLEAEGVLHRLRGVGMVVASTNRGALPLEGRMTLLDPQLQHIARQARELELPGEAVLRRLNHFLRE